MYNYSVTTNGVLCDSTSVSGTITVTPKSIITAVSTPTLNQTVCDDVDITPIGFSYSGSCSRCINIMESFITKWNQLYF